MSSPTEHQPLSEQSRWLLTRWANRLFWSAGAASLFVACFWACFLLVEGLILLGENVQRMRTKEFTLFVFFSLAGLALLSSLSWIVFNLWRAAAAARQAGHSTDHLQLLSQRLQTVWRFLTWWVVGLAVCVLIFIVLINTDMNNYDDYYYYKPEPTDGG